MRKRRVQQWKILDWPLHLDHSSGHPSLWSPFFYWPFCTLVILWGSKYPRAIFIFASLRIDIDLTGPAVPRITLNLILICLTRRLSGAAIRRRTWLRMLENPCEHSAPAFAFEICIPDIGVGWNVAPCSAFLTCLHTRANYLMSNSGKLKDLFFHKREDESF